MSVLGRGGASAGIERLQAGQDSLVERIGQLETRNAELSEMIGALLRREEQRNADDTARWERLFEEMRFDRDDAEITWELRRRERDGRAEARTALARLREERSYPAAFDDPDPLVTVRIASYRRTRELCEVAIPSVLAQTHSRLELVVVNDGPNDETREAIERIGDERIRYEELPTRSDYPSEAHLRWMVAGSPAMNRAVELARGSWIAPLDDDDEFSPDHIERLLALARERRAEVAYGAVRRLVAVTGEESIIYSDPPAISRFSFQGAIYLRGLSFMAYDTESWRVREPGDWNLIRRMMEAGVRVAGSPDIVATMHQVPLDLKSDA